MSTKSNTAKKQPETATSDTKRWDVSDALRRMNKAFGESFRLLAK